MSNKPFTISVVILLSTIVLVALIARRGQPVVVKTNLENMPIEIAGFKATEDFFPEAVYKELNADKHVYRHYRNADGKQIDLYIGYYGTAKGGRTGHNPYGCLPGAGWAIVDDKNVRVISKYYTNRVGVNYVLARKGETYESILHWYQSAGKKVISGPGFQQNFERFKGRVFYNRNDGAFVRVSVFTGEKGIEEANLLVKSFAQEILDLLPSYWPLEE